MCGIFFALSHHGHITPDDNTAALLRNRGPDHTGLHQPVISQKNGLILHVTFLSTVLSLRGTELVSQPLIDDTTGSVLCWNGEAWSINSDAVAGNDSRIVFSLLLKASQATDSKHAVIQLLSNIRGPYAIVFHDTVNDIVYYGRDCLGRRSLLKKATSDDSLVLSSVCDNATGEAWEEVEADGISVVDLNDFNGTASIQHIPHTRLGEASARLLFNLPFPPMNHDIPDSLGQSHDKMLELGESLRRSLTLRTQHVREAFEPSTADPTPHAAKIAILFSGGLDCTLLARLCHDLLPLTEDIDLLNVAFENPRIHSNLEPGISPYELCPDRITGRSSHAELERVCPNRTWRFIQVNVPYTDTIAHRSTVLSLMHPHNTEMDLSISYALYFASRGSGIISGSEPYTPPAHVLLSGLGADELFGGYQRHATAFSRHGHVGLCDELALDFSRLGKRNLGRDDRVISNSGREVRFPFLDEDFIALALQMRVQDKCDFSSPDHHPADAPDVTIEPAKRVLRCLAWELGMHSVAREKKRAIQFGARTAKMETGKTKGTTLLT